MIPRRLTPKILAILKKMPIATITGPRQSGKTTLLKHAFPKFRYVSLEALNARRFAQADPRQFLTVYKPPAILDEVQHVPDLFSYIQTLTDETNKPGQYILSGSQHFGLMAKITQSLAGRTAIFTLLPLSLSELIAAKFSLPDLNHLLFKGFYPRVWSQNLDPLKWYPDYIQTYLERDIRQLKQITDLVKFKNFLQLCAGRTGQLLNLSSLANDAGISHNTAAAWISVLETSYIVFRLHPYYRNFNKRLIKSPKLYFYDPGLVCSLLGIETPAQIQTHPLRGQIFETFVVSELRKIRFHVGRQPNDYFLRDNRGREIDYLIDSAGKLTPIEIKIGQTVNDDYFDNLKFWQPIISASPADSFVIYGGNQTQPRRFATVVGWKNLSVFENPSRLGSPDSTAPKSTS